MYSVEMSMLKKLLHLLVDWTLAGTACIKKSEHNFDLFDRQEVGGKVVNCFKYLPRMP